MDRVQFLIFVFAVLLPNLCNALLCNYRISLLNTFSFSILEIAAVSHIRLSKFKLKLTFRQVLRTNMRHCTIFRKDRSNRCGDRPTAIL